MELKKLLYAVDLEDAPHPAIEHVKMVASLTGASVSIVYVLPSETVYESNYLSGEGQPNRIAPTQALLEKMEHFLNTNFPEGVDDCAFLMGKISEEVVKYAHKSDIDCIVVGAHGRIGFRQLFRPVVGHEVVKRPTAPYPSSAPDIDGTPPCPLPAGKEKHYAFWNLPPGGRFFHAEKRAPNTSRRACEDGLTRTSRRCNRKQSMRNAHGRHF